MRDIIMVLASLALVIALYALVGYWDNDRVYSFNCNMLIGGWHPDIPTKARDMCIEKIKRDGAQK